MKKKLFPLKLKKIAKKIAGVFLIFLLIGVVSFRFWPNKAEAAWFDENWAYRTPITITTHTAAESNVYVIFFIDTATPIAASKMQSDCGDLRFTTYGGSQLPYYIGTNNGCNSTTTEVHVSFASFPAGSQTIYYYYGNPSAPNGFVSTDFPTLSTYQGSTTYQVGASSSDVEQVGMSPIGKGPTSGGNVTIVRTTHETGRHSSSTDNYSAGYRFTSVAIPQGSTVNKATFKMTARLTYSTANPINYVISMQAADTASAFSTVGNNTLLNSIRPRTTADSGNISANNVTADTEYSYTVTSAVQEVINRAGWVSGNAFAALVDVATTSTSNNEWQDWYTYDNTPSKAARMFVIWTATGLVVGAAGTEEQAPQPAAYWKFDDGTGTSAKDSTSNANTGTLAGTTLPTWQTEDQCVSGKCLYFNGITSKVTVANTVNSVQSISFWAKPATSSASFVQLTSAVDVRASSGTITTSQITSPTVYVNGVVSSTITPNQWNYITVTTGTGITANSITLGQSKLGILNGFMDEVKLYSYVRTAAQIKADYTSRSAGIGISGVLGSNIQNNMAALNNNLMGYWKMDEASWAGTCSGTPVIDSSGNGLNGNACPNASAPSPAGAKFGNGANLDGTNDRIEVADNNNLDITSTDNFTLSTWVNETSTNNNVGIFNKKSTINTVSDAGYAVTRYSDGSICMDVSDGSTQYEACTAIGAIATTGIWYHITAVFNRKDPNTSGIYINGIRDVSGGVSSSPGSLGDVSNALTFYIGSINVASTTFFPGKMDEVRLYKRAFSPSEVQALYNWAPGPVGYWNFEEHSGQTINDGSGNALGGTLGANSSVGTDDPTWSSGKIGSGLTFNGSSQYVNFTDNALYDISSTASSSWSYYIKPSAFTAWSSLWSQTTTNLSPWMLVYVQTNADTQYGPVTQGVSVAIDDNASHRITVHTKNNVLTTTQWYHLEITYDNSQTIANKVKIYINGVDQTDTSDVDTLGASLNAINPNIIHLGFSGTSGEYFNGSVDDVKIYNYARTSKQVIEDMNGGHPAPGSPVGSPLGYWKFDEGNGLTTGSIHNSGNGGTVLAGTVSNVTQSGTSTNSGSGWTTSGKFQGGFNFEGTAGSSNDLVNVGSDSSVDDLTANPMSLSAWIYPNTIGEGSGGVIMAKNGNSTSPSSGWLWQLTTTSNLKFSVDGSTDLVVTSTGNPITLGAWNHVVLTWDGVFTTASSVHMYVNGREVSYGTQTNGATRVSDAANSLLIGNNNATGTALTFDGTIDEVKVFTAQLTKDQIKLDMNRGAAQILGALGSNSSYQANAANQEYCVPGDATSCAAPIGKWDFEEGSGSTANDSSGNANTGTLNNGAKFSIGKVGKGVEFTDNTQQHINAGSASVLDNLSARTVCAWIYPRSYGQSATDSNIFWKGGIWGLFLGDDNGGVQSLYFQQAFGGNTGLWRTGANTITLKTWQHICVVYSSASASNDPTIYINGKSQPVTEFAAPSGTRTSDSVENIFIGNWLQAYNGAFDGILDQVRLYNYARSAAQVAWEYNRGAPVGWWKMDECSGATVYDSSGNGNTGTFTPGAGGQTTMGDCTTNASTPRYTGRNGKINYGLNFDNNDDFIDAGSGSTLDDLATKTVCAWIKPNSIGETNSGHQYGEIVTKFTISGSLGWAMELSNEDSSIASVYFYQRFNSGGNYGYFHGPNNAVTLSSWNHVCVTYDDTSSANVPKIYINGISQAVTTYVTPSGTVDSDASTDLAIGSFPDNSQQVFDGIIDDVRVYNYILTASQIKNVYNGGAAVRFAPITGAPQ